MGDPNTFLGRFARFNAQESLLARGDRVLAAVSGGMDSMVLLHCLMAWAKEMDWLVFVAHLNHGLRGPESDADEAFVRQETEGLGVKVRIETVDLKALARDRGSSLETTGREVRYEFLERQRLKWKCDKVATGHHGDDQAETVLLNLFRGSGFRGAAGMPLRRDCVVRPLLFAYREDLRIFAAANNISYREDSSNQSYQFRRNRIRHQVMPLLRQEFNERISERLNAFSQVFREGDVYLQEEAQKALKNCFLEHNSGKLTLDIGRFCSYFTILQKYMVFELLDQIEIDSGSLSFAQVEAILKTITLRQSGKYHELPQGWIIAVEQSGIVLYKKQTVSPVNLPLKVGEAMEVPAAAVRFTIVSTQLRDPEFQDDPSIEFIDAESIDPSRLRIRSVRPGDSFYPLGLGQRQKLSDFFINKKIPLSRRSQALVLTSNDEIVWLCGYRLDHRYRVVERTTRYLKLTLENG